MDVRSKLKILADAAKYDASCASSGGKRSTPKGGLGNAEGMGICHSYTPDGRCVSLLKILLTNFCIYDCQYCINRISSDVERARFSVQEVVQLTIDFYKRNYIEGLFLSSGVIGSADNTMELLTEVARQLRTTHRFGGYIHLKLVPGASPELVDNASRYADRVSANIEMPTEQDLVALAPDKTMKEVDDTMLRVRSERDANVAERKAARRAKPPKYAPAGQSTQMIVGASPTPDKDIVTTAGRLYSQFDLRRVYYSAYSPIPDTDQRLPPKRPELRREHRLYEADWLIRFYGFEVDELFEDAVDLDLDIDPKLAWALRHRDLFPLDINRASRSQLLRIPGLGTTSVKRILRTRRYKLIRSEDMARLNIPWKRSQPFVTTADPPSLVQARLNIDQLDLRTHLAPAKDRQLELLF